MFKFFVCLAILAVSLRNVRAKVSEESEKAFLGHADGYMKQCGKELNLDVEEIKKLHVYTGKLEGIDKCFVDCVLKKDGTFTKSGKVDLQKALEILKEVITNEDDLKVMEAATRTCVSVNDLPVSDGDKGCERAYHFAVCFHKEKNQ